jgi:hypothetical protein
LCKPWWARRCPWVYAIWSWAQALC